MTHLIINPINKFWCIMRKMVILLSLTLLPIALSAQKRMRYMYDASGNRIRREIVMEKMATRAKKQSSMSQERMFAEVIHNHAVKIPPNPTEGILSVSIGGLNKNDHCTVGVYTIPGIEILRTQAHADEVAIDIRHQPAGVYLLRITINEKSTTWKIIKK